MSSNLFRPPLIFSRPPSGRISEPDVFPNLLVTTLRLALPAALALIASAPQVKAAVRIDDFVQRPQRTLGINPPAFIQRLDQGAPFPKYQIQLDVYPNLHSSTLHPAVSAIPVGKPVDTSQLQPKYNVCLDPAPYPFVLQPGPVPALALSTSAPGPKYNVQLDSFLERQPLTLGVIPTFPHVRQQTESAPQVRSEITAFLAVTMILPPPPSGIPVDTSQLQLKYNVTDTNASTQRPLALGIIATPSVQQLSTSAPPPKYQIQLDTYPNLHTSTLAPAINVIPVGKQLSVIELIVKYAVEVDPARYALVLQPAALPLPLVSKLSASAPAVKYQPQVDVYPRLLLYLPGPALPPGKTSGRSIDTQLPQVKYQIYPDVYPNLIATTIRPHLLPIPLPLGLLHDFQQFQSKYQIQLDTYPNVLPIGIRVVLFPDQCKQLFIESRLFLVQLPIRSFTATLNSRPFNASWEC